MPRVFRGFRRVAVLVAAPSLVLGSGLAPLHEHESDADHAHVVVHRHYAPHQSVSHDEKTSAFDDDEHVVWLDTPVIHALPFQLDVPSAVLIRVPDIVTPLRSWSVITFEEGAPAHGPPRPIASLRGPPILPV
jgi:hypothetical protein